MNSANLFIDWSSQFHNPPWQACDYIPITPNQTSVFNLMNDASSCNPPVKFTFEGNGDSAYLTSIDGVENNQNGNGYYWVFLVNGKMANVGFAAYKLSDNDSVVWDYKHFSSGMKQANQPDHPLNKQ
ncbi:DUF4430 domain-containing protein [uncultured Winogradskyella sp.]|uniref:DUF4430 domain-containing protein n=1 Tax=uncultured Winogradskyella sp. TaxID=395353 RepID=UPI00262D9424|nr:DUF4430 domain-containing protein [uncultured Winogradskyella sp.]